MREKRLLYNIVFSFGNQLITIICGFVLPRLILAHFGSTTNGLVASITQFLGIISFLEMGIGMVVQSSLYEPLANSDNDSISSIYMSATKFFHRIAGCLVIYVIVLCFFYPEGVGANFTRTYIVSLLLIISLKNLIQYVFGITDRLLLCADQKGYIIYISQACTTILNTILCVVLMWLNASIHLVKFMTSAIYLIMPIVLHTYVIKKYRINRTIKYTQEPIKQKWNGIAQHISAVILDGTDMIVLTAFSSLNNVSIYSVFSMVVQGVTQLTMSLTRGLQSLVGELLVKRETEALNKLFSWSEWAIHTSAVFIFGCCSVLIIPFVQVYTNGIHDANYLQPCFGLLLTLANAGHCLRLPYNIIILAGGHYKQTQSCYIIAAILNIVISILCVKNWGLIGVAIGTVIAMVYQTIWMAHYISRNIIYWPLKRFYRQCVSDGITFAVAYLSSFKIPLISVNYFSWFVLALCVGAIWIVVIAIINLAMYRQNLQILFNKVKSKKQLKNRKKP